MGWARLPETPLLWTPLPRSSPLPPCCPSPRSWPHPPHSPSHSRLSWPAHCHPESMGAVLSPLASQVAHGHLSPPHVPRPTSQPLPRWPSPHHPHRSPSTDRLRKASPLFPDPTPPCSSLAQGLATPQVHPHLHRDGLCLDAAPGPAGGQAQQTLHQDLGAQQRDDEGQGTSGWLLRHVRPPQATSGSQRRAGWNAARSASCCQGRPQRTDPSGHMPARRPGFPVLLQPEPSPP